MLRCAGLLEKRVLRLRKKLILPSTPRPPSLPPPPASQYIAADLLAQAEHDTDALPVLVTTSAELAAAVDVEIAKQLAVLPTRETASVSIAKVRSCPSLRRAGRPAL